MKPYRLFSSMVVTTGAILLSAPRPANNKRNVELDGQNGHLAFIRDKFIRPNTGTVFGSDSEKFGFGGQVSRAIAVGNAEHRADNKFVRRKRSPVRDRAFEKQFRESGGDHRYRIESSDTYRIAGPHAGRINGFAKS